MSTVLQVQAVDVPFGGEADRAAPHIGLRAVTFDVDASACLAVLGASGSGKSSLLRALAGLHAHHAGRVLVRGRDVTALPAEQRGIVYLHQEPVLFPHLSVLGNVAFPLRLRGVPARDADRRAVEWLERLHVGGVSHNRADALSGGQRHRVALARALCAEPAVLLLDEPLSSLDPTVRRDVRAALLEARAASGAAMVLVTHDLDDALAVGTQLSLVDGPTLSAPADPARVLQAPPSLEAARLLGVFAEVPGVVSADARGALQFRWAGGSVPVRDLPAGAAVACVRAHEVLVQRADAREAGALTVTARHDAVHDVALTLRAAAGATVVVRTAAGTTIAAGDVVHATLAQARCFPPR